MEFVGCDLPIPKLEEMIFRTSTKQSVRIVQGQKLIVFGFLLSFHKTETKKKAVVVLSYNLHFGGLKRQSPQIN